MKDFKPEYAGKMSFYLSVFDDTRKTENDNPSIGLLLCKGANKVVAEYALRGISQPVGVSSFLLTGETLPKELQAVLPSVEAIEVNIEREVARQRTWVDEKVEALKKLFLNQESEQIQSLWSPHIVSLIFKKLFPLFELLRENLTKLEDLFMKHTSSWSVENKRFQDFSALDDFFSDTENLSDLRRLSFRTSFDAYKMAGKNHFNVSTGCEIFFRNYDYELIAQEEKITKLYHEFFEEDEINFIVKHLINNLFAQIESYVNR